jgi:hypothetical protein
MGVVVTLAIVMISGYVITSVLGIAPDDRTAPAFLNASLVANAIAASLGGATAMRFAPHSPRGHVLVFAGVLLLISLGTLFQPPPPTQPGWYNVVNSVIGPLFALLGGVAAAKVSRRPAGPSAPPRA